MDIHEPIILSFSLRNVKSKDLLSASDPYLVLTDITQEDQIFLGKTETHKNDANPDFSTQIELRYHFEQRQDLLVTVFDSDKIDDDDFIGSVQTTLAEIVSSVGGFQREVKGKFTLIVNADVVRVDRKVFASGLVTTEEDLIGMEPEEVLMRLNETEKTLKIVEPFLVFDAAASHVDRKDFLGKSDPYFCLYKMSDQGNKQLVFKSKKIKQDLDPDWGEHRLTLQDVCSGDTARNLTIEVFDWDKGNADDLIGIFETSVDQILQEGEYPLINQKKLKKKKYENSGIFHFRNVRIEDGISGEQENPSYRVLMNKIDQFDPLVHKKLHWRSSMFEKYGVHPPQFLSYLQAGTEISLIFGIDFTGSNGSPESPSSLHYIGSPEMNSYEQAIFSVGNVVAPYDDDQLFPVYGYGASMKDTGRFPDRFPINFRGNPEIEGIENILDEYRKCVTKVSFGDMGSASRPGGGQYRGDDFYQLIKEAIDVSKRQDPTEKYYILVLIIDGDSFDNKKTIDTIVEAQDYPISIIIIGVGTSNFSNCIRFDADDEPLTHSNGTKQKRDVVQFVKFEEFKHDRKLLASEVLREIPEQLVEFMMSQGHFLQ